MSRKVVKQISDDDRKEALELLARADQRRKGSLKLKLSLRINEVQSSSNTTPEFFLDTFMNINKSNAVLWRELFQELDIIKAESSRARETRRQALLSKEERHEKEALKRLKKAEAICLDVYKKKEMLIRKLVDVESKRMVSSRGAIGSIASLKLYYRLPSSPLCCVWIAFSQGKGLSFGRTDTTINETNGSKI